GVLLCAKDYRFDIARRQTRQLDARLNGIYLPGVDMGCVRYCRPSVVFSPSPARTETWLHLPIYGQLDDCVGRENIVCKSQWGRSSRRRARVVGQWSLSKRANRPSMREADDQDLLLLIDGKAGSTWAQPGLDPDH